MGVIGSRARARDLGEADGSRRASAAREGVAGGLVAEGQQEVEAPPSAVEAAEAVEPAEACAVWARWPSSVVEDVAVVAEAAEAATAAGAWRRVPAGPASSSLSVVAVPWSEESSIVAIGGGRPGISSSAGEASRAASVAAAASHAGSPGSGPGSGWGTS